jgi:predicted ATPase
VCVSLFVCVCASCIFSSSSRCTRVHLCMSIHAYIHTHTCIYKHIHTYIHTYINTHMNRSSCTSSFSSRSTNSYIHKHIHTYIHKHTHTQVVMHLLVFITLFHFTHNDACCKQLAQHCWTCRKQQGSQVSVQASWCSGCTTTAGEECSVSVVQNG